VAQTTGRSGGRTSIGKLDAARAGPDQEIGTTASNLPGCFDQAYAGRKTGSAIVDLHVSSLDSLERKSLASGGTVTPSLRERAPKAFAIFLLDRVIEMQRRGLTLSRAK
jgi:hypothetical protein